MKKIHKMRRAAAAATVSSVLILAACGSNSSDNSSASPAPPAAALPAPGVSVPASAANSVTNFLAYLMSLTMGDETSEPSPIADSFTIPDDPTNDSAILG